MTIEFKLPSIADGVDDGEVSEVYVSVGDVVQKDDPILELEVSKGQVPVPCDVAGTVTQVHVNEGDIVPIGAVLLTLEPSEAAAASEQAKPASPARQPETPQPEASPPETPQPAAPQAPVQAEQPPPLQQPVLSPPQPVSSSPTASSVSQQAPSRDADEDVAAGPAIRRFAREVGVDLSKIQGTGTGGRIQREDVLQAVRAAGQANAAAPQQAVAPTSQGDAESPPERDKWGPVRIEKLPRIRKAIANKMHESWSTAPRVTNFDDADVTELEMIRQSSKADYARKNIKLTSMPFLIKAVAMALRQNPTINASIDMENNQIVYKDYVNIGIAVDTDRGLVVPSLRAADEKSIQTLARELGETALNVREGSFALDDLAGSTFTISNLGAIGGTYSTPIINVPEVAILLVGRSRKMPVVIDDEVVVRFMMPLSLSYDHRLVDGGAAAKFLNEVIELLGAPSRLLLAP